MKTISSKNLVVAALVVIALYTVSSNVLPLLQGRDADIVQQAVMFDEEHEATAAAKHTGQPVQTSVLFWNTRPARNPFSNRNREMMQSRNHNAPATPRTPVLSGFVAGERSRLAVLDDRIAAVGDTVSGHRVVAIDAGGVHLLRDGQRLRLTVGTP